MSNFFDTEHDAPEYESIASLAQNVIIHVPGCADMEVRKALQAAYADFCRCSSCYCLRREIELEAGEREYPVVAVMPGCFVDSVTEVRLGSRRLVAGRDYRVTSSGCVMLVLADHLVPDAPTAEQVASRPEMAMPRDPQVLVVTAIDLPKMGSEKAPRWFFNKYGEAVVAGALVRLLNMTGKAWTDGSRAQHELIRWENYLTDARLRSVYADDRSANGGGSISALDTSGLL